MTPPPFDTNRFRALFQSARVRPLIIAHRGDSAHAPENTLEAAELGFEAGADVWELDVHLTRDGVPVVIHDESLTRTTNVARRFANDARRATGYRICDFDLDEIRVLDAGSWFVDPSGGPRSANAFGTLETLPDSDQKHFASGAIRVPTLREALQLTERLDWLVNVELKSFPCANPNLVGAVLRDIDAVGCASRVLVSSFDHADLARLAGLRPTLPTGVLTTTPLFHPDRYVRELLQCEAYHPSAQALGSESEAYLRAPGANSLRVDDLLRLKSAHVPVLVYTVNDGRPDGLAAHLIEAGVSGLFSDSPQALRSLLGS